MIKKINEKISEYKWMEFEVSNGGMDKVLIHAYLDEADEDIICLVFENVDYIQCKTSFTYEGNGNVIEELVGEEAREINIGYSILKGKVVYKIINTNIQAPMYIVADSVKISG